MRSAVAVLVVVLAALGACEDCEVREATALCNGSLPQNVRVEVLVLRNVTKILKGNLSKYENLTTIDASNSGLHHIDHDAFLSNEKLTEINLSGNKLHIPADRPFFASKSLTHLNLSHTNFGNVSENIFSDLPNLQEIDLSSTAVMKFSPISKLEQLKTLIIFEDPILNKNLICHDTHLQQIIAIDNGKQLIFNCSHEDKETKNKPIVTAPVEAKNVTEDEQKLEETTEAITTKSPEISAPENLTVSSKAPETLVLQANVSEVNKTETSEVHHKIPDNEVKMLSPENGTSTETEETTTEISANDDQGQLDSLMQFPNLPRNEVRTPEKTHDDIKHDTEQDDSKVKAVMPQPETNESSGTNIVLGIILCVMIVGALGFGYKYWKGRRQGYRNANTEDVEEGKELQNMVGTRNKEEE